MADFAAVDTICAKRFKAPYPARTTIAVAASSLGTLVAFVVFSSQQKPRIATNKSRARKQ